MAAEQKPQILLVDDDPQVLEVYVGFLEGLYELETATSGRAALDLLTEETDVVLLDRRIPDMKGADVAEAIREHGYDCQVAMVTALTPEVDIIDFGIDDYLVKPVTGAKLRTVIDSLLRWREYDDVLGEYYRLARKATALEQRTAPAPLDLSQEYRQLNQRLTTLEVEVREVLDETGADVDLLDDIVGDRAPDDGAGTGGSSSG